MLELILLWSIMMHAQAIEELDPLCPPATWIVMPEGSTE